MPQNISPNLPSWPPSQPDDAGKKSEIHGVKGAKPKDTAKNVTPPPLPVGPPSPKAIQNAKPGYKGKEVQHVEKAAAPLMKAPLRKFVAPKGTNKTLSIPPPPVPPRASPAPQIPKRPQPLPRPIAPPPQQQPIVSTNKAKESKKSVRFSQDTLDREEATPPAANRSPPEAHSPAREHIYKGFVPRSPPSLDPEIVPEGERHPAASPPSLPTKGAGYQRKSAILLRQHDNTRDPEIVPEGERHPTASPPALPTKGAGYQRKSAILLRQHDKTRDPEIVPPQERLTNVKPQLPLKGDAYYKRASKIFAPDDLMQDARALSKHSRASSPASSTQSDIKALNSALVSQVEPSVAFSGRSLAHLTSQQLIVSHGDKFADKISSNIVELTQARKARDSNTRWRKFCTFVSPLGLGGGTTLILIAALTTIVMLSNPFTFAVGAILLAIALATAVGYVKTRNNARIGKMMVTIETDKLKEQLVSAKTAHKMLTSDLKLVRDPAEINFLVQQQKLYFNLIEQIQETLDNPEINKETENKAEAQIIQLSMNAPAPEVLQAATLARFYTT